MSKQHSLPSHPAALITHLNHNQQQIHLIASMNATPKSKHIDRASSSLMSSQSPSSATSASSSSRYFLRERPSPRHYSPATHLSSPRHRQLKSTNISSSSTTKKSPSSAKDLFQSPRQSLHKSVTPLKSRSVKKNSAKKTTKSNNASTVPINSQKSAFSKYPLSISIVHTKIADNVMAANINTPRSKSVSPDSEIISNLSPVQFIPIDLKNQILESVKSQDSDTISQLASSAVPTGSTVSNSVHTSTQPSNVSSINNSSSNSTSTSRSTTPRRALSPLTIFNSNAPTGNTPTSNVGKQSSGNVTPYSSPYKLRSSNNTPKQHPRRPSSSTLLFRDPAIYSTPKAAVHSNFTQRQTSTNLPPQPPIKKCVLAKRAANAKAKVQPKRSKLSRTDTCSIRSMSIQKSDISCSSVQQSETIDVNMNDAHAPTRKIPMKWAYVTQNSKPVPMPRPIRYPSSLRASSTIVPSIPASYDCSKYSASSSIASSSLIPTEPVIISVPRIPSSSSAFVAIDPRPSALHMSSFTSTIDNKSQAQS
ncbi:hypothetical protein BKA69DRAFT_1122609 [Paraphysoderma sedebokerense]|nr:hypothetical protein BKA69DRAFT_1122609 [Paraphysoderma sedebokerense]